MCLSRKQDFLDAVLGELERGTEKYLAASHSGDRVSTFPLTVGDNVKTVPCRFQGGRFFLKKKLSFLMSGLAERRLCDGGSGNEDDDKVPFPNIFPVLGASSGSIIKP